MTWRENARAESIWLHAIAGAALLGGPIWNYLYVNGYPLRLEAIVLPAIAACAGALIGVLAYRLGPLLGTLPYALLLFLYLDLQFDTGSWKISTLALGGLTVVVAFMLRARRSAIITVVVVTFNIASLPARSDAHVVQAASPFKSSGQPLLVHLVLDELWGIGGLRAVGDTASAEYLTEFYLSRGFDVYEAAYSRRPNTEESMPSLVSLGGKPELQQIDPVHFRLRSNPYFRKLQDMGYPIHAYETSYLDYCTAQDIKVAWCAQYDAVSVANIGYLGGEWTTRSRLALHFILNAESYLYERLHGKDKLGRRRSFAGRGLTILEDIRQSIPRQPGAAIFAHVLIPHRPLEVDATCQPYPASQERVDYDRGPVLSEAQWRDRLRKYSAQVRCVHIEIAALIATIDSVVGRENAIVLIHGDHGSRLTRRSTVRKLSELDSQDLNAAYSTFLALRLPGGQPQVHQEAVPVQDFFWHLVRSDFRQTAQPAWPHYVIHSSVDTSEIRTDTIRWLEPTDMLWWQARPASTQAKP